jgi:L,D-peptidoglycan transpeptidase YkuD (ErfK/YbiS/YcfS/YnhG family)
VIFTAWSDGVIDAPGWSVRCALGRSGVIAADLKREGDGASPLGVWPIRRVLYRPDRGVPPRTALSVHPIAINDGWCDAAGDVNYNRPVQLPYPASAERLWREDRVYDIVVVLGHNDDPPQSPMGSAIFMHIARPDWTPTEGCVALTRQDLEKLLAGAAPGDGIAIRQRS